MKTSYLHMAVVLAFLLPACGKEPPPPRSVDEFVDDSILLEATILRCSQDRSRTKYEADCVNAREAANRLAVIDEEARRKALEAQSERKRRALRRTQEAAAEARRRAAEAQRQREEDEYLGVFETAPGSENVNAVSEGTTAPADSAAGEPINEPVLDGNQPGMTVLPVAEPGTQDAAGDAAEPSATESSDIDSIREELKRRQDPG